MLLFTVFPIPLILVILWIVGYETSFLYPSKRKNYEQLTVIGELKKILANDRYDEHSSFSFFNSINNIYVYCTIIFIQTLKTFTYSHVRYYKLVKIFKQFNTRSFNSNFVILSKRSLKCVGNFILLTAKTFREEQFKIGWSEFNFMPN